MINEEEDDDEIHNIIKKINELNKAYDLEEVEVEMKLSFEKSCAVVTSEMHKDAKTMTVMEFESALAILKEKSDSIKRH
jgi:hypothetical protein